MDLSKFIYSDIGENILERFYNEGKELNLMGNLNDYLSLPMNENLVGKEETKEETNEKTTDKNDDEPKNNLNDQ